MTVESNDSIPIPTLSDLLKDLAPVFQPVRSKTKPPFVRAIFPTP